ncbi:hypothetical protein MASR1M107_31000 [Ignavibacteriales bacterium]
MKLIYTRVFLLSIFCVMVLGLVGCDKADQPKAEAPATDSVKTENQMNMEEKESIEPLPPPAVERRFYGSATAIVKRAYFYSSADLSSRRRDYIIEGQSAEIQREKGDFIYTRFVYGGRETRGWMYKRDFMISDGTSPSYNDNEESSGKIGGTSRDYNDINGIYSFKNSEMSARITILGDKWFGNHKIMGELEVETGLVKGKDLMDESGFVKVGFVSGNKLHTTLFNRQITLRKE